MSLSEPDRAIIRGFRLLTAKPFILVANTGEDEPQEPPKPEGFEGAEMAALCAKLEMELSQMEPEDENEFRGSLGLPDSAARTVTGMVKAALDVVTFFTGNEREARAWPAARGTTAIEAAGSIHSDFARGFIRAEVIAFDDFTQCGSLPEARRRGLLRQEGRGYAIQDGDVVNILFSV